MVPAPQARMRAPDGRAGKDLALRRPECTNPDVDARTRAGGALSATTA
ncbi:hypothetical protein [Streptomyces sp. S.PNR 29]|nr:hypothetical protein [Streptomyces sp. S.PNR 29]MDN0196438.1 hypothetical protein [Streptomyces sp. S.PNR 29]